MKQTGFRFFSCDDRFPFGHETNLSERILKSKIDQLLHPLEALGVTRPFIRLSNCNKSMELIIANDNVLETQCKTLINYFNSFGGKAKTLEHPSGGQTIITFKSNQLDNIISNLPTLAFVELADTEYSFKG